MLEANSDTANIVLSSYENTTPVNCRIDEDNLLQCQAVSGQWRSYTTFFQCFGANAIYFSTADLPTIDDVYNECVEVQFRASAA